VYGPGFIPQCLKKKKNENKKQKTHYGKEYTKTKSNVGGPLPFSQPSLMMGLQAVVTEYH
jgi:hypothetical protein